MNDTSKREQEIAIAYQSGMENGERLDQNMEDTEVTRLGIERGEQWATAAIQGGPYPERL
jgi:hypothetical protein